MPVDSEQSCCSVGEILSTGCRSRNRPLCGSNPGTPAPKSGLFIVVPKAREKARTSAAFCVSPSLWCAQNRLKIPNFCRKSLASTYKIPVLRSRDVETCSILNCSRVASVSIREEKAFYLFGSVSPINYDVYLAFRTGQIYEFAASVNLSATTFSASKASLEVANAASASYAMISNGLSLYPKRSKPSAYERRKRSGPRIFH